MTEINKTIEILKKTLITMPEDKDIRMHIASLQLSISNYEEAKDNFEYILKKYPEDIEALSGMGKCSFYLDDLSDTRIFLGKLLKLTDNKHAEANLYMAKAYITLNDIVNAREYYTRAVNQDTNLADDELRSKLYDIKNNSKDSQSTNSESFQNNDQDKIKLFSAGYEDEEDIINEDIYELRETITFSDVGGLDNLKETIKHKIIYPFKNPEVYQAYGKKAGGGILLYGPPGCGKTYIAKATAGECDASFIDIGINDVLDMWLGESEKKLHNIFDVARRKAPSIIFIDEIDALGGSRQASSYSSTKMLVNQLLSEMDGMDSVNDKMLIIGATNSPWFVDSALRRPGRFDRIIFVPPPDTPARIEILQIMTCDMKIARFDFKNIASKTNGFSGADIKALVNTASEDAINEAMKTGNIRELIEKDFLQAIKKIKPSTKEWFSTAKNYATYANQAGIYDEILEYLNKNPKFI
ncbi:MAG: AAA family ATPase [Cyanobacteriota bacterium]